MQQQEQKTGPTVPDSGKYLFYRDHLGNCGISDFIPYRYYSGSN